jgi:hypothetical protein
MGEQGVSGRIGRIGSVIALTIGLGACGGYISDEVTGTGFFAGGPIGGGPQSVDAGLGALVRGDFTLAERYFKGALRKDPKNPYALFGMGVIYHTMGETGKAREMYETALAQQPGAQKRMIPWNGTVARPLTDVVGGHLALLESGGVLSSVGGALPPMSPGMKAGAAGKVGGAAAGTAVMGRGGAMLPAAGTGGDIVLAGGDVNVVSRFKTLAALRDQGLITPDEFQVRRQANIGALLPLSAPPPSAGLERPVPGTDQIVDRLKALARALETRNISIEQHAAERIMILDALVPAAPVSIADARGAPRSAPEAAELAHRLDFMRKNDLVSQEEFGRERAAIEASAAQFRAPSPPPAPAKAAPATKAKETKAAAKETKPAKGKGKASGPQHGVHLASYRSQKAAEAGWSAARKAAGGLLDKLEPEIRKVDLPKGTFYRLKAGPLPGKEAAADLCRKLKARKQFCDPSFINID